MKINLLVQRKFGPRKRGSNTIPVKIFQAFPNNYLKDSKYFINFYRIPELNLFNNNLVFTYSKSIEELKENKIKDINKRKFIYFLNKDKIISNGFMYSKYYNMQYYPRYFYKIDNLKVKNKKIYDFEYGIYNRPECLDEIKLLKFLKDSNIDKSQVLIFGKEIDGFYCTTNQKEFFNNFKMYLINNENNDAVSNTVLECLYYKKKFLLMNREAIANDSIQLIKAKQHFGYDNFFKKLDNLNNYCWSNLNTGNSGDKLNYINKIFKKSKTLIDFLDKF